MLPPVDANPTRLGAIVVLDYMLSSVVRLAGIGCGAASVMAGAELATRVVAVAYSYSFGLVLGQVKDNNKVVDFYNRHCRPFSPLTTNISYTKAKIVDEVTGQDDEGNDVVVETQYYVPDNKSVTHNSTKDVAMKFVGFAVMSIALLEFSRIAFRTTPAIYNNSLALFSNFRLSPEPFLTGATVAVNNFRTVLGV